MVTYRRIEVYAFLCFSPQYKWLSQEFYEQFCHLTGDKAYDIYDPQAMISLAEIKSHFTPRVGGDRELLPFLRQMQSKVCGHMKMAQELLPA